MLLVLDLLLVSLKYIVLLNSYYNIKKTKTQNYVVHLYYPVIPTIATHASFRRPFFPRHSDDAGGGLPCRQAGKSQYSKTQNYVVHSLPRHFDDVFFLLRHSDDRREEESPAMNDRISFCL